MQLLQIIITQTQQTLPRNIVLLKLPHAVPEPNLTQPLTHIISIPLINYNT
jgi:hypothetical protein